MKRLDRIIKFLRALEVRIEPSWRVSDAQFLWNLDPDVSRLATFFLPLPRQMNGADTRGILATFFVPLRGK